MKRGDSYNYKNHNSSSYTVLNSRKWQVTQKTWLQWTLERSVSVVLVEKRRKKRFQVVKVPVTNKERLVAYVAQVSV